MTYDILKSNKWHIPKVEASDFKISLGYLRNYTSLNLQKL